MDQHSKDYSQLSTQFFSQNYDYLWLKTMLDKGCNTTVPGSTLITGSSYALNGIYEKAWKNAVNCSMHSQDLYYDFKCARRVISSTKGRCFDRCIIIVGYWSSFHDVSLSKVTRTIYISRVWYPIFHDAHNWELPDQTDPWAEFGNVPEYARKGCENAAAKAILEMGSYYPDSRLSPLLPALNGRSWDQASADERLILGRFRADQHNALSQHRTSFEENKGIFQKFVRFLYEHNVIPIVVVPPFSMEYNCGLLSETKESLLELLDSVPEYIHYVDFNEAAGLFVPEDFQDSDHLSAAGAKKMSSTLVDMFGQ